MNDKFPPLNAIKAFAVSAKYLSFSKAAEELCVTQGAISKQVKILEDYLEFPLFIRLHKKLELTKKGKQYYRDIDQALETIKNTTNLISKKASKNSILTINTIPSFSSYWLIPKIGEFKKQNPNIDLNVVIGDGSIDFDDDKADIAIRTSSKKISSAKGMKFMDEEMYLIASPTIAKKIKTIKDIVRYSIIEHSSRSQVLDKFLKSKNLNVGDFKNKISLEHFFMVMEAVKSGVGVALVPKYMLENSLDNSQLSHLLDVSYKSGFSYYVLFANNNDSKKVRHFCEWLCTYFLSK